MEFTGHIEDGVVVLDNGKALPEGARVRVVVFDDDEQSSPYADLLKLSGIIDGLPEDFAENHDHYIHGQPKR
jgi:hypothetical protein